MVTPTGCPDSSESSRSRVSVKAGALRALCCLDPASLVELEWKQAEREGMATSFRLLLRDAWLQPGITTVN